MQSHCRLIEHVQGVLAFAARGIQAKRIGAYLREFGDELDALALAAGQRRAGLAQTQVAEPDIGQQTHGMVHAALRGEEIQRFIDAHRERLADALALEQNGQGLGIESPAAADVAQHLNVG